MKDDLKSKLKLTVRGNCVGLDREEKKTDSRSKTNRQLDFVIHCKKSEYLRRVFYFKVPVIKQLLNIDSSHTLSARFIALIRLNLYGTLSITVLRALKERCLPLSLYC